MNEFMKNFQHIHIPTDKKVVNANEILFSHKDYHLIKGTEFVSGTLTDNKIPTLNYRTPEHFTEEQIGLAETIVQSLPSLNKTF